MARFRQQEIRPYDGHTRKCGLEEEDDAPGFEGYDDAADEGAQCWPDQSPGEEPAHGGGAFYGAVDVADATGADGEEGGAFERGEDPEDEVGGEVWG